MKIEHSEIIVTKITKNSYMATCIIEKPIKSEINMSGAREEIARKKLEAFLRNEPYSHLDSQS